MPYFTVVIPTYNAGEKLARALRSVISQTFADFEIVVVDDGSTDATESRVAALEETRIRYEWNRNSGGPATPRNRGIELARGEWICLLDADDLWYPNKLKRVHEELVQSENVDVVCHWELTRFANNSKTILLKHGPCEPDFYRILLEKGNRLSPSATCIKRQFLLNSGVRFNQSADYVIVEDYDCWMNLARHGASFRFIEEVLGEYMIEDGNISANNDKYFRNLEIMLRDHVYRIQSFRNPGTLWRTIEAKLKLSQAKTYFASGATSRGVLLAVKVAICHPFMVAKKVMQQLFSK